jgi:DNA polymerase I-like protein with 3'-5' exonuclease and polymerase domains
VWLRGLIKPTPDRAIAYLDWRAQEVAIAAALSSDDALWDAYASGDPYLAFAKRAGLAPETATKETHGDVRNRCKAIVLGVQYGMSAEGLAARAGIHIVEARDLMQRHMETYRRFWAWAEENINTALLGAALYTRFGWPFRLGSGAQANPRSLLNWPMQSNGAEMMHIACCEATEADLMICAPIHDSVLLEAPLDKTEEQVGQLTAIMQRASALVLGEGRVCGVDAEIVRYRDRYSDERGRVMWHRVMALIEVAEQRHGQGHLAA